MRVGGGEGGRGGGMYLCLEYLCVSVCVERVSKVAPLQMKQWRGECLLVLLVNVVQSFDDFFQNIGETFN